MRKNIFALFFNALGCLEIIEWAKAIVAEEGGNLCLAARDQGDEQIAPAANALGQAIVDALLEVFDGLTQE